MNPEKREVREALVAEQHHVCIYCGKRITAAFRSSHIEHFRPQSIHSNQRFDWPNLFASCGPIGQTNVPEVCGGAKRNWDPAAKAHIEPTDAGCEQRFAYDGNGAIFITTDDDTGAQTMIDTLNLDDHTLAFERFVIISDLETRIGNGSIDAANKAAEIALWREVDADGRLKGYGHIAARYLDDQSL